MTYCSNHTGQPNAQRSPQTGHDLLLSPGFYYPRLAAIAIGPIHITHATLVVLLNGEVPHSLVFFLDQRASKILAYIPLNCLYYCKEGESSFFCFQSSVFEGL